MFTCSGPHEGFKHPDVCWKDSIAGSKKSRKFMEYFDSNFLTEVIEEPTIEGVLLDWTLIRKFWTLM